MKKIQLLGGLFLLASTILMTSCEKDTASGRRNGVTGPKTETPTPSNSEKTNVLVLNALPSSEGADVNLQLNADTVASGLGLGELTQYVPLNGGDANVKLTNADGDLMAATNFTFLKQKFYTIVLTVGPNGVTPAIKIFEIDPLSFNPSQGTDTTHADSLGSFPNLPDLSGMNFANLLTGLGADKLLMGSDILSQTGAILPALTQVDPGQLSGTIFGNNDVLSGVDALRSNLKLDALLAKLQQKPGTNVIDLNGVYGILNSLGLNSVSDLLGSILGQLLGSNPLTLLDGNIIDPVKLQSGHDYTTIITGTVNNVKTIVIDQTAAGLPQLPQ